MTGTTFLEPSCRRVDLDTTDTFTTAIAGMAYATAGSDEIQFVEPQVGNAFRYSQSTQRYSIIIKSPGYRDSGPFDLSTSFDPRDAIETAAGSNLTTYQTSCLPIKFHYNILSLFNPGATNSQLVLNYASFGAFTLNQGGELSGVADYFFPFAYGLATPIAALNRTGTAIYNGPISGKASAKFLITGTVKVTVDFDHKTSSTVLDLKAQSEDDAAKPAASRPSPVDLGTFTFNGSGDLTQIGGTNDKGKVVGFLAGPAVEEAGISGQLTLSTTYYSTPVLLKISVSGAAKR